MSMPAFGHESDRTPNDIHSIVPHTPPHSAVPDSAADPLSGASFRSRESASVPQRLTDGTVFVLDDDRSILHLYSHMLANSFQVASDQVRTINPIEVFAAMDPAERSKPAIMRQVLEPILEASNSPDGKPSLVITDFEMGVITGAEVIGGLYKHFGGHPPFRILLNSSTEDAASRASGYDSFLPKGTGVPGLQTSFAALFP